MAALDHAALLLANEETFVDKKLLYVAGGLLVITALVLSFLGARKEDFPSPGQLKFVVGLTGLLVIATAFGAIQTARFEQADRRAENEAAAAESAQQDVENQQSLDEATAGEASQGTGTGDSAGSSSDTNVPGQEVGHDQQGEPQSSTGATGTQTADIEAGRTLFTQTGCGGCHTLADAGTTGQVGPVLDDFVPDMTADEVRTSIVDPGAKVEQGFPDGTMPTTYGDDLDETQIDTLVAYLTTVAGQ